LGSIDPKLAFFGKDRKDNRFSKKVNPITRIIGQKQETAGDRW
tara:strand:+ start:205 stop:333 length:129 start_codon:yes stop_codon:yes gene_type:complete